MDTRAQHGSGLSDRAKVIDQLVNTYRELNTRYRVLGEEALVASGVRDTIDHMRRDEMLFAQALKERVTGVGTRRADGEEFEPEPVVGAISADDSPIMVISQFGNARATTLTLLKQLEEEDWNKSAGDGQTILQHAQDLVENDRVQLAKLEQMIAGR